MSERPRASRRWHKGHGLGNDYLVFEEGDDWLLTPGAVAAVCHRTRGVGSDGIVVRLADSTPALQRLRMFNPDGSEFERSGNGLRIFGGYLAGREEVASESFQVEVGGGRVELRVLGGAGDGVFDVSVAMGRARFGPGAVDAAPDALETLELPGIGSTGVGEPPPEDGAIHVQPVSVGNPHAVVFLPEPTEALLLRIGPYLTDHRAFAHGVNVQLARVEGPGRLRILIWERGVGRTSASGTSSCAAAAAAVRTGRLEPGEITVAMEGGELSVAVDEDYGITLRGPVQNVTTGELDEGFLRSLRDPSRPVPTSGPSP